MPRRFNLLDRLAAASYEIARQSWILSNGRGDDARLIFEQNERIQKFSPLTILAMLQFALWLWDRWHKSGTYEPSVVMNAEEMAWLGDDDE